LSNEVQLSLVCFGVTEAENELLPTAWNRTRFKALASAMLGVSAPPEALSLLQHN
jgi:hypothetical protein